jgi:hypothetical protein
VTFSGPRLEADGIRLQPDGDRLRLSLQGREVEFKEAGTLRSGTITPFGDAALVGGDRAILKATRDGKGTYVRTPAPVTAVNVTPDAAMEVAALADGTIRWYRAGDGHELLALFVHPDRRRWVAWTPSGYYDASVGGDALVGWRVDRGAQQAPDFFAVGHFRDQYYRPGVIAQILALQDEAEAVRKAGAEGAPPQPAVSVLEQLPPVVSILKPDPVSTSSEKTLTLEVAVRSPSGAAVGGFRVMIDGRPLPKTAVTVVPSKEGGTRAPGYTDEKRQSITLPLPSSSCTISVQAQAGDRWSELSVVRVNRPEKPPATQAQVDEFEIKPALYLLSVGISAYQNPKLKLNYAAKDAKDFAAAMKAQEGNLYRKVEVRSLVDATATANNIRDGLEWLERQTTQHDVAVLFIAGHGMNDTTGQYHFLPWEADPNAIKRTMLPDAEIQRTLAVLAGKVLFFFDTCHAGNVLGTTRRGVGAEADTDGFTNELISAETGAIVFASSSGGQVSQESADWKNGAFTRALVEALSGQADYNRTGRITVKMVDLYLSERVKALTNGTQTPTTGIPSMVRDFPIALSKH